MSKIPYFSGLKVSGQLELKNLLKNNDPYRVLTLDVNNNVNWSDYTISTSGGTGGDLTDYYTKGQTDSKFLSLSGYTWSSLPDRPTFLSQFTNNLGNYGNWITAAEGSILFQPLEDQRLSKNRDVAFNSITSTSYTSGSFGTGFRIDGYGNAEFTNLSVRNIFNVNELKVNKITASNGSIAVTDGIKITIVTETGSGYVCEIETGSGTIAVPFAVDDIVRCQVYNGTAVKYYLRKVTAVTTDSFTLALIAVDGTDTPEPYDEVVRFGNTSDISRQGLLYLTSSDSNSPYLDVLDGVTSADLAGKTKVRLGKLNGITDASFGALSGYGLYAENAYIKGTINVTGGNAQTITGSETLVNNAKAEVIASATTLSTNAENAAKAYAEAQDDLSETIVKAYADGIVDAEEARAIADAQAKLLESKAYSETKAAEAQANAISTASADASTKLTEAKLYVQGKSYTTGKLLNRDPDFAVGNNGITVYNNAANGNVTIDRLPTSGSPDLAVPTTSGYFLRVKNIGVASPELGGFYFATQTRANAKFIARIVANIPVGHSINYAANSYGSTGAGQHWVTPTAGTGKWEEYISVTQCGSDGVFSSINFFYIDGAVNMEWYVASAAVYDVTDSEIDYIRDYTAKVDAASVILQNYTNSQIAIASGATLQDAYNDATAKANAAKAAAEAASNAYAVTVSNSAASAAQIAAAADASAKANQAYTDALAASNSALTAFANTLKALAYEDVVEISKLGNTVIDGGYLKNTLIDTVYLKAAIINASQIVIDGGGATTAYADSKAATAKSEAIAEAILKDKIVPVAGGKIFNNPFSISSDPVNASLVIHTNIQFTGNYMNSVRIKGYNYLSGNNDIDLTVGFYSYASGLPSAIFHETGFISKGTYTIDRVRLAHNTTNNTVSIIIGADSQNWSYPKVNVDTCTSVYNNPPDSFADNWTGTFTNNFTGLSVITDISGTITESTAGSASKANTAQSNAIAAAASDATSKSNAAQSAAQSYAASQAAYEREVAKAYADGIVDAEESARLSEAAAKLAEAKTYADSTAAAAQSAAISSANSTALGYAQSYANIAEGNAINTAANDATTKANAAKAAAEAASNAYAVTQASAYASQAEINAAADASAKATNAYNNAVAAAASAQASLVSTLKAMAYQDVVEVAKLGTSIISGGYIKTDLLDADYIKSSIINSTYVNTLSLDASIITTGLLSATRIDVDNIVAKKLAATEGYIAGFTIDGGGIVNESLIMDGVLYSGLGNARFVASKKFLDSYGIEIGSSTVALGNYASTGYGDTQNALVYIDNYQPFQSVNTGMILGAYGATNNIALRIEGGAIITKGWVGYTTQITAGGARMKFVDGLYVGPW